MLLYHGSNQEISSIDWPSLVSGLEYKKLNDQYSFHTVRAIALLSKVE